MGIFKKHSNSKAAMSEKNILIQDNGMPFVVPSDEICAGRDGNSACYR